jgi:hypothetical protein
MRHQENGINSNNALEWQVSSCEVTIPANTTKIRLVLNAGWSSQQNREAVTFFDANEVVKINDGEKSLNPDNGSDIEINQLNSDHRDIIKEYSKVNPTLWKVHVNASEPVILAFAEPFDIAWEASVYKGGEKVQVVKSAPLYGSINSFLISESGQLEVVIKYVRQDWFEIGLVISAFTFSFCIFYIFYKSRTKIKAQISSMLRTIQSD